MVNELYLKIRDTPTYIVEIKNNEQPFDITNFNGYFTVKKRKDSKEIIVGPITGIKLDAQNGKITFSLTTTDSDIEEGIYYYDVELVSITGDQKFTVIDSKLIVGMDVKR